MAPRTRTRDSTARLRFGATHDNGRDASHSAGDCRVERRLLWGPEGRRRTELGKRWATLLDEYAELIAVYDVPAARATAEILVDGDRRGRPMGLADAQIAGICVAQDVQLATRNVRHFDDIRGLVVVNPFLRDA